MQSIHKYRYDYIQIHLRDLEYWKHLSFWDGMN
jgi:hypothetical protein